PLRDALEPAGQYVRGGRVRGDRAARPAEPSGAPRASPRRERLHYQRAARGPATTERPAGRHPRRQPARAGPRLAAAPRRSALVFLEEREVGARAGIPGRGPSGLLGAVRLPHARRSLEGRALLLTQEANGLDAR